MRAIFVDATPTLADVAERLRRPGDPEIIISRQADVTPEALPTILADATVALIDHTFLPTDIARRCPGLKHVVFLGTGARSYMSPEELARLGIEVHTIKGYGDTAVAEAAIALMWASARVIPWMDREMRAGNWLRVTFTCARCARTPAGTCRSLESDRVFRQMKEQAKRIEEGRFICPRCGKTVRTDEQWGQNWPGEIEPSTGEPLPEVLHAGCDNPPRREIPPRVQQILREREQHKRDIAEGKFHCTHCGKTILPRESHSTGRRGEKEYLHCARCIVEVGEPWDVHPRPPKTSRGCV